MVCILFTSISQLFLPRGEVRVAIFPVDSRLCLLYIDSSVSQASSIQLSSFFCKMLIVCKSWLSLAVHFIPLVTVPALNSASMCFLMFWSFSVLCHTQSPGAKVIKKFRAWIGAQLKISCSKFRNWSPFSVLSLSFVLRQM